MIHAPTVMLYLVERSSSVNGKFDLGVWEIPILVVAVVWLAFELALFRDAASAQAWAHVLTMVAIGAAYLLDLLIRHGRASLNMPDMTSIGAELRK